MQSYLEKIQEFAPEYFVDGRPKKPLLPTLSHYSMISIYAALMASAAILSFVGAFFFYWPLHASYRWIGIVLGLAAIAALVVGLLKKKA